MGIYTDKLIDKKGEHYYIDRQTGEHYKTVHCVVKDIRDGVTPKDLPTANYMQEYTEPCPYCGQESGGVFDLRNGLVTHCSNCDQKILICSMCDNCGFNCGACPEETEN